VRTRLQLSTLRFRSPAPPGSIFVDPVYAVAIEEILFPSSDGDERHSLRPSAGDLVLLGENLDKKAFETEEPSQAIQLGAVDDGHLADDLPQIAPALVASL